MISRSHSMAGGQLSIEPVLPSYLDLYGPVTDGAFSDMALRKGEVIEVIPPSNKDKNLSGKFIEYKVAVQYLDPDTRTGGTKEYPNCVLINPFAGMADKFFWKLRADTEHDEEGLGKGSKVLVLCINSERNVAVILGGIRDEKDEGDQGFIDKDTLYFSEFNGIRFTINGKGEAVFQRRGATKIDGTNQNDNEVISGFTFQKNGSVLIGTGESDENSADQKIYFNRDQKTIEMIADKGIQVGKATDKWPLFSTYRKAESQMNNTLVNLLTSLVTINEAMATLMKTAAGLMAVPVVGCTLAAPSMLSISIQMTVVTQLINAALQAIRSFESQDSTFYSTNNRND